MTNRHAIKKGSKVTNRDTINTKITKHADCRITFYVLSNTCTFVMYYNFSELIRKISPTYNFSQFIDQGPVVQN